MPYAAIEIEGLFPADLLERIATGEVDGQRAMDFGLAAGARLADELQSAYSDVRAHWDAFQRRLAHSSASRTTITREAWAAPLLERLGYALRFQRGAEAGGDSFAISHRAGDAEDAPAVNVVSIGQRLDARIDGSRRSPHTTVQEFLNRSDVVWGIVTNGERLRLLRDTSRLGRPSYLEFDLQTIVEDNLYSEFVLLYRLVHRTRLPQTSADTPECWMERYYQRGIEEGGRVRERLREGVEKALLQLANGLLTNPASEALRARIVSGDLGAGDLYRQLLRLVYRLLFLMVVEERRLVFPPGASSAGSDVYLRHYGLTTLRERADRYIVEEPYDDLWQRLVRVLGIFRDEAAASTLGLVPFDGDLFAASACPDLEPARCANAPLLRAIRHISTFTDGNVRRRVNFAALDVEELGSVYESLLDYEPHLDVGASPPRFLLEPGAERRATGSYYTPPSLVQELVEGALVPVMTERLAAARDETAREEALLGLRVLDLASGSGHFLLAAGRRIARELAKVRARGDAPSPPDFRRALREVIRSCLYAVDKNPLAIDLCKVALWLESHDAGLPLAFLDHRVKLGDSLVGVADLAVLEKGIPDEAYERVDRSKRARARTLRDRNRLERAAGQQSLGSHLHAALREETALVEEIALEPDDSVQRVREHADRYSAARERGSAWWRERVACDLWTAPFFADVTGPVPTTAALQAFRADPKAVDGSLIEAASALVSGLTLHWPIEFPEVTAAGGFDIVLSNPPFMGGYKISSNFGDDYRRYLLSTFPPAAGTADLCAFFFRRAFALLRPGGRLGMIGTKTLHEGDTREAGLKPILEGGGTIASARRTLLWPGEAGVHVDLVAIALGPVTDPILDGAKTEYISSRLDAEPDVEAVRLAQNRGKAFQGSIVLGLGFVLRPSEAEELIARDRRNRECLFPYLNGEDLSSSRDQTPSRWVIQFDERSDNEARRYPDLWQIVEERVHRWRQMKNQAKYPRMVNEWWKHWNNRRELYSAVRSLPQVLVRARVSVTHAVCFVPSSWIYDDKIVVFATSDYFDLAILQSGIHEWWARRYSSTLRGEVSYAPTDCFENFPFPQEADRSTRRATEQTGRAYDEHRAKTMRARGLGLTKTYNLVNDDGCTDEDIVRLRALHAEVDQAVIACYGWSDLDLGHGFHANQRGQTRFAISPDARREILRRLLALNAEVARREREKAARPKWESVG